jgi:hypothetical protein
LTPHVDNLARRKRELFGPPLVYTGSYAREMQYVIEASDEEQFAKGQDTRDLRVSPDATIQFTETIDSRGATFFLATSRVQLVR